MSKFPFTYKVNHWNDIEEKMEVCYGLLYAEDFNDAMKELSSYYGKENLEEVDLKLYADGPIETNEEALTQFMASRENY